MPGEPRRKVQESSASIVRTIRFGVHDYTVGYHEVKTHEHYQMVSFRNASSGRMRIAMLEKSRAKDEKHLSQKFEADFKGRKRREMKHLKACASS